MDIFSFGVHFTDEKSCRLHYKEQRDREGVVCHRCQGTDHYWLRNKWSYQCKGCKARISLRSGTIMESSKLSFMTWYLSLIHISEPTRRTPISYAVFCLKKKKKKTHSDN